jgi:hypothetical protein
VALERDADGRCTDLVLMAGVDGMAFHIPLWRPWEGRRRPLRVAGLLSQARLVGPAKRGRAPSESSALTSMRAEIGARPKGRICAPIDKVEPTVDTAGPQVAPALKEEAR